MTATYSDALGSAHKVDETVEIRDWWRALKDSSQHLEHNWAQESAKSLREIAAVLKELVQEIRHKPRG